MSFFRRIVVEAHRRSLWQVLGIYLAVSWVVFQVAGELTEHMGLPEWVPGFAFVLLLIGLPIVLATAFVQEGAPGLRPEPRGADAIELTLLDEAGRPVEAEAAPAPRHHLLFTWKKAALGGIAAFLLLGITAAGYLGMRDAGIGPFGSLLATGELGDRERILIAEFRPLNGDTVLATTVTEAFRVDFAQSAAVTVVQPKHVREVLQRMSRDPKSRVDVELAHEIAVRDNIKAYLAGEVSEAGEKYVVAARLIATRDSRVLASYRETAADAGEIINAVDRVSKKLRSKIGESLKTIHSEKPLEAVSTPSLEALQKYTQAAYAIDTERDWDTGISLLHEAIEHDSAFAMAWRKLSVAYGNSGRGRELAVRAATKAYQFRDRLTDAERYHATAFYYHRVKNDWKRAISAYSMLEDRDPNWPPNNLGLMYLQVRDFEKAADAFGRSIAKDSTLAAGYENLAEAYAFMGDYDNSARVLTLQEKRFGHPDAPEFRYYLAAARRDYAAAEREIRTMLAATRNSPVFRARAHWGLADLAHVRGRLAEGRRQRSEAVAAEVERGNTWQPLSNMLWEVWIDIFVRQDPKRAIADLESALAQHPLDPIPPLDRPYLEIASVYAVLGQATRAREYVGRYEAAVPAELRGDTTRRYAFIEGMIALNERRFDQAVASLRRSSEEGGPCAYCTDVELALVFEEAAQPDSAIARYEHFLATPSLYRIWEDSGELALAYERLAELYAAKGNRENAVRNAARFVELWQDADAELQPRVQAKRELLRQLGQR